MAGMEHSRRGFVFAILATIQGLLLAGPGEARAVGILVDRLEMEGLTVSKPRRVSGISLRMTGEGITLYRGSEREKIPLCSMNHTGKRIWDLCDGNRSPKEIGRLMMQQCLVSEARVKSDVLFFLRELKKIGAIRL